MLWRQVTSHCCLPVAYVQQVYDILLSSCHDTVLYAFNASHTLRMACHICIYCATCIACLVRP
jgi:hypothetical protein